MARGKSCCFTGHRVIPQESYYRVLFLLRQTVENKIKEGYTDFYAGGALGFDTLAALTVLRLKMMYKNIRLHLILPCISQADKWSREDKRMYERIKDESDKGARIADFANRYASMGFDPLNCIYFSKEKFVTYSIYEGYIGNSMHQDMHFYVRGDNS